MKVRIASGVIGFALLFGVIWSGEILLGFAMFLVCILSLHEFYTSLNNIGLKPVKIVGYIASLPILFISLSRFEIFGGHVYRLMSIEAIFFGVFIMVVFLLSLIVFLHSKYSIVDISLTLFGVMYIPFMFLFVVLTRSLDSGFFLVWLIFIGAFATDTFAYFAGRFFGKRKLMPVISPKKTVEGSIGGVLGCVALTVLYGFFLKSNGYVDNIAIGHFVVIGLLCSVISQIGDWSASAIKRYVKVKDYGNIMPGHGGALDRFDSIIFVAPIIYFYLIFFV